MFHRIRSGEQSDAHSDHGTDIRRDPAVLVLTVKWESSEKSFLPGSEDKPFESLATQSGGLQRIRTVPSE
jgi:hypothetical protein